MTIRWDLPPLTAVRAFEAAARNQSMSGGASELNVTHAAVSQQVRALEDWLGVQLFLRRGRRLTLTAEGATYAEELRGAFQRMEDASRAVRRHVETRLLEVATTFAFASRWLTPRLGRFQMAHPEVAIRLSPSRHLVDFRRDPVDVAIRFGEGNWPGLISEPFLAGRLVAVCSPSLLPPGKTSLEPSDLDRLNLLHDTDYEEWRSWVRFNGWEDVNVDRGDVFGMTTLGLEAAIAGRGVALMVEPFVEEEVASGRLIGLSEEAENSQAGYYLVYREQDVDRANVAAFLDWMRAEAHVEIES
ncbi:MAG: transcriptional regulator GcvA [Minwuia sp.]|uniref:transcriptional regulator GcvA n=1 Tax=Minwuia sp. TaxID=2493630 RepID=UPI003A8AB3AB